MHEPRGRLRLLHGVRVDGLVLPDVAEDVVQVLDLRSADGAVRRRRAALELVEHARVAGVVLRERERGVGRAREEVRG